MGGSEQIQWPSATSAPREPRHWTWLSALTAPRVGLAAGLFFLIQVAWFTYPNEYAATLATLLDADPFRAPAHPVWQFLLSRLLKLPVFSPSAVAGLLNAACGALVVGLMFAVSSRVRLRRSKSRTQQARFDEETAEARQLAGLLSALYSAASLPLLIVFTRQHPLAVSALLGLLALWLTQRALRQPSRATWLIFCGVYGLGCAEWPTFFLLSPLFGLAWLWILWRQQLFTRSVLPLGLLVFAAAYAVVLLACWSYFRSEVAGWRGFTHFGAVLHFFVHEQIHALRTCVPKVGWITIAALMVAPGLSFLRSPRDEVEDINPSRSVLAVRAVLAALALIPLYDGVGSPWRLTGPGGLLVAPYLITALWFGRLVSLVYWQLWQLPRSRRGRPARLQRIGVPALAIVLGLALTGAAVRHVWMANVWRARPLVRLADEVLAGVAPGQWLITDGSLDAFLHLRAHRQGREVHLINRTLGRNRPYLRYLATRLPDAELRGVVAAGLEPMLRVWLSRAAAADEVRVQDLADLWVMHGYTAVPEGLMFAGRQPRPTLADVNVVREQTWALLSRFANDFGGGRAFPPVEARYFRRAARHLGLLANNLGVLLEDVGQPEEAGRAYRMALDFDAQNSSALCNLLGLFPEEAERENWLARLRRVIKKRQLSPGQMTGDYGFIRDPGAYARQALAWAAGGRNDSAVERARQALDLAPTNTAVQLLLAQVLKGEQADASVALFEEVLQRDPDNREALLGLARRYLDQGDADRAEILLDRAQAAGLEPRSIAVERALVLVGRGRRDEARALLLETVRQDKERAGVWMALALMAMEDGDASLAATAVEELKRASTYAPGQLFLADYSLQKADPAGARAHLERAAAHDRGNPAIWERWATLDYVEGRLPDAARRAGELLALDPENTTASYLLGMIHLQEGEWDLAEATLRRSLKTRPTAPVCHGLALTLLARQQPADALPYARQAVKIQNRQPAFWATLGRVLVQLDDLPGAAASFDQALNMGYRDPATLVVAADAFQRNGQRAKTDKLLVYLEARRAGLDSASLTALKALKTQK